MTFEKQDTTQKISELVAQELHMDQENLKTSVTFQDLGADSLDMVQLVMKMEEQFGIEINDEDAEKFLTLADVIDYIHQRRSK